MTLIRCIPPPTAIERELLRSDVSAFAQKTFETLHGPGTFVHNWHHDHLAHVLDRAARGELTRVIINVPPRSGKSILASVAWPLYVLGMDPTREIICISHTADLARKFSLDRRRVLRSPWYRRCFSEMEPASSRVRELELRTTRGGAILAVGIEGSLHGRNADFIVIDDPLKGIEALSEAARRKVNEAFDQSIYSRLNDKRSSVIVIIMQRLHEDDLTGHVLSRGGDDWYVVSLPAIAIEDTRHDTSDDPATAYLRRAGEVLSPREPLTVQDQNRRMVGSLAYETQWQQSPSPRGGLVIKREWLKYYVALPRSFDRVVASWDTASTLAETSDWSVGTVWGARGLEFYLIDVVRERLESHALRARIVELHRLHKADVTLIEETELGRAIAYELRNARELAPVLDPPRYDKLARLLSQAVRFESGQVHLPREAPWLAAYEAELLSFPTGKFDDQVDATSQALRWLNARQSRRRHGPVEKPKSSLDKRGLAAGKADISERRADAGRPQEDDWVRPEPFDPNGRFKEYYKLLAATKSTRYIFRERGGQRLKIGEITPEGKTIMYEGGGKSR